MPAWLSIELAVLGVATPFLIAGTAWLWNINKKVTIHDERDLHLQRDVDELKDQGQLLHDRVSGVNRTVHLVDKKVERMLGYLDARNGPDVGD